MAVRLNIGCQKIYKPGYINICENENVVADFYTASNNLPYKDNSVDIIETYNYTEQLSHFELIQTLEEWFRVLKPNGYLIIETFNSENIIRDYFRAQDNLTKESSFASLFEDEKDHSTKKNGLFPEKLFYILKNVGFDNIEEHAAKLKLSKNSFRMISQKPVNCLPKMVINKIKKEVINKLPQLNIKNIRMHKEFVKDFSDAFIKNTIFSAFVDSSLSTGDLYTLTSYSPKLTSIILNQLSIISKLPKNDLDTFYSILNLLDKYNFVNKSYLHFINIEKEPRPSIDYYVETLEKNTEFIANLLNSETTNKDFLIQDYLDNLQTNSITFVPEFDKDVFSLEKILQLSEKYQSEGIKLFTNNNYEEAYKKFYTAVKLNPELVVSNANIGLLQAHNSKFASALEYFDKALLFASNNKLVIYKSLVWLYLQQYEDVISKLTYLEHDIPEKYSILGHAHFALENYNDAFESFYWASIRQNSPLHFINLGIIQKKLHKKQDAEMSFNKAKKLNPSIEIPSNPIIPPIRKVPFYEGEL